MTHFQKFLRPNLYLIFIIGLATILRFYAYDRRWAPGADQVSFALLSRFALFHHHLPLFGPFSSAGPFQTGGEWYWLIMAGQAIFPFSFLTPWVVFTIFYVVFVFLIYVVAKEIGGKNLGLLSALFAAVSTSQIAQSANLTNQTPIAFISLLALWSSLRYLKAKKDKYIFLLGFFVGLASAIHSQGFALAPLILVTLVLGGVPKLRHLAMLAVGLFLPWLPIFIADSRNHFHNTTNIILYYSRDQYKISFDVLGRRWITYLFRFWPQAWAHTIGGSFLVGWFLAISIGLFAIRGFIKKTISREWILLIFSTVFMIGMLRYIRTPIFDSYLMFLHPFIFILSSLTVLSLYKLNKYAGIILVLVILIFSLQRSIKELQTSNNKYYTTAIENIVFSLTKKYPNTKFDFYDFSYFSSNTSQAVVLLLDDKNLIDDKGKRIGLSTRKFKSTPKTPNKPDYIIFDRNIYDLTSIKKEALPKYGWESVNPSFIYYNVQEWYKFKK